MRSINTPTGVSNSDILGFSAKSSVAGDSEDGVWTGQNANGHHGTGSDGGDSIRQRAPSIASSAFSTGTTGTAWDELNNGDRPQQTYRSRIASSRTSATEGPKQSGNWAKQGAAKPDRAQLREAEKRREAVRKVQEQERARYEDEDEEESGSDWEL